MSSINVRTPQEIWDAALEIFDAAREVPAAERSAFVESRCGDDVELLAEVRSLIHHLSEAGDAFLRPADIGELAERHECPDALLGQVISAFTIQSVIARGGMGTVYLARQANPDRDVALKVLSPGFWSAAAERRFVQEAQILARLQHPNIAQVYEAGSHRQDSRGVVRYFAMELVPNAKKITEFADDLNLAINERLTLFLQICDAVQYGHSKGIIHRDLKPANILVGSGELHGPDVSPNAMVKVIDFGVARVIDMDVALTTMHTDTGQLIGTLAYMSPEQCDTDPLGLDVRSDVYSLGVVLYELLCGRLPYDVSKTSIAAAAETIRGQEPRRPSLISRKLRGDIEIILLKSLEKDRTRRYSTVADLSRDLRHLLDREPIEAKKPTRWIRTMRWAARRPKAATTACCIGLAFIVIVSTYATVLLVNFRPHRLEMTKNGYAWDIINHAPLDAGDCATLYSLDNRTLYEWRTPSVVGVSLAKLVDRPSIWGGGRVIVLGFNGFTNPTYGNSVCAFNADGPFDTPLWYRTIDQEVINEMPIDTWPRPRDDADRMYISSRFRVTRAWMFDVFTDKDCPGPEIIAFHMHSPGSQGALRIYNLNGDVLFQAWQDGGIGDCYWIAGAGVLVLKGMKGDKDASQYRGGERFEGNHCQFLCGISPRRGDVTQGWILPHKPDWWNGDWYRPLWYVTPCPSPFGFDSRRRMLLGRPENGRNSDREFTVHFTLDDISTVYGGPYHLSCVLDSNGAIVKRNRLTDASRATWTKNQSLPNPALRPRDLEFLKWTSTEPPCGQVTTQAADPPD